METKVEKLADVLSDEAFVALWVTKVNRNRVAMSCSYKIRHIWVCFNALTDCPQSIQILHAQRNLVDDTVSLVKRTS